VIEEMCQLRSKLFLGLGLHFFCCAYYNGFKPAKESTCAAAI
jgi:hypothetical protein